MYDPYAAMKDITRPRSSGTVQNKHAVRARPTTEPNYEKMRELSHPPKTDDKRQDG